MPSKPHDLECPQCGRRWVGVSKSCPNGCDSLAKSGGEVTRKTFQGDDNDLKKGPR